MSDTNQAGIPTAVWYGTGDALAAEIGTQRHDTDAGGYYVQLTGGGDWDAESFHTLGEAREEARALAGIYSIPAAHIR